ncbi:hypothetical protein JKP88DRAFT_268408 [Tribonema minus]|uniref:ER membrane protein complex subunit 7 beta-sandwich domain-containing protein n=1 Tax=Tribonema minus TaxID=303371 RepID=A0A836CIT1_9STRA|nr:hypothetical protein JKP88DRAFT_268408 [Tribonema minus]
MAVVRSALAVLQLLLLAAFIHVCAAVSIQGKLSLPEGAGPLETTRLTLNGGERSTYSQASGAFVFHGVGPGVYVLDVQSTSYHFSQMKIKVPEEGEGGGIQALEFVYPGAPKKDAPHPLALAAHAQYAYFEPREAFNVLTAMRRNPMLIIMALAMGAMALMPKLMEGMDPELLKQAQAEQKQMLRGLAGGGGGGGAAPAAAQAAVERAAPAVGGGGGGGGGQARRRSRQ